MYLSVCSLGFTSWARKALETVTRCRCSPGSFAKEPENNPFLLCDSLISRALPLQGQTNLSEVLFRVIGPKICTRTYRLRYAPSYGQSGSDRPAKAGPAAHFERNPLGRGRLAVFPRCSLDPYQFRYGRFARALKNSQLTRGDVTIICETVH
jgi:hypothetical protein